LSLSSADSHVGADNPQDHFHQQTLQFFLRGEMLYLRQYSLDRLAEFRNPKYLSRSALRPVADNRGPEGELTFGRPLNVFSKICANREKVLTSPNIDTYKKRVMVLS